MRIIRDLSSNPSRPATDPVLEENGLFIEFRGGDYCHPRGSGDWFKPPYFKSVARFYWPLTLTYLVALWWVYASICLWWPLFFCHLINPGLFISWRTPWKAGYWGAKIYGVDSEAYKNWLPENEVYAGSQALMFSIRPFIDTQKEDARQ